MVYRIELESRRLNENMRIAICGGTGFIGQALTSRWQRDGHEVIIVTRSKPDTPTHHEQAGQVSYLTWDQMESQPEQFEQLDALVNLAGSSLSQRWTSEGKKRILKSREQTVSSLAETFDEDSPAAIMDFPSEVVQLWEQAADHLQVDRLIKLRISVVLGDQGGALPKMLLPYKLGVGGRIGSGKQWLSWIHIDDMVSLIDYCIRHEDISGIVNAASRIRSQMMSSAGAWPRSMDVHTGSLCLLSCSKQSWAKCRSFC